VKAEILPLSGKYYGTEVEVKFNDPEIQDGLIQIWITGNWKLSLREIGIMREFLSEGLTEKEVKETYPDGDKSMLEDWVCDSHYETETSYKIAQLLVDAINRNEEEVE